MAGNNGVSRRSLLQLFGVGAVSTAFARRGAASVRVEPPASPPVEEVVEDEGPACSTQRPTKLESFLKSRGIKPAHLAHESGYSRQHLLRLRLGRMLPTKRCALHLTAACRRLSRERVRLRDLFDTWLPTLGDNA